MRFSFGIENIHIDEQGVTLFSPFEKIIENRNPLVSGYRTYPIVNALQGLMPLSNNKYLPHIKKLFIPVPGYSLRKAVLCCPGISHYDKITWHSMK